LRAGGIAIEFPQMSFHDASEARLAALVASSDDAILSKDLNGVLTSWNRAAEQMFGYTAEEAIGQNIVLIVPDDRRSEEDYVLSRVREGTGVEHYETVRRNRAGALFDVSLTVSPIRVNGVVVGASTIARDITASKRIEREAARLAAIVSSSEDAIVSKDLNGYIQTWNRAAERIFGYTAEEAIGRNITIVIPDDRLSEETEVLTRIRAGFSVEHFETVRRRKDGQLIHISLAVSPIRDAAGRITGASKIARDVTAQRRLQEKADDASRMKDEFLAVLSHELRTPLNTVLGYARMLRRDDKRMTDDVRERALDALERNADTLTRLVNDVLDTSRVVTGKLRLAMEALPLDAVVVGAVETVQPVAEAKQVAVKTQIDRGLSVVGDRDRLQQVVWNLLSNAIKFTPSGGSVTVRLTRTGSGAEIAVQDTGIGIASADLPYVFQRFWQAQTGASREYSGLGIGLALARHLVELHGGAIAAASAGLGTGATFTVTLPIAAERERQLRAIK
jgi:PAS domain S-box-containing protein